MFILDEQMMYVCVDDDDDDIAYSYDIYAHEKQLQVISVQAFKGAAAESVGWPVSLSLSFFFSPSP